MLAGNLNSLNAFYEKHYLFKAQQPNQALLYCL
jgi:hypothetical protein